MENREKKAFYCAFPFLYFFYSPAEAEVLLKGGKKREKGGQVFPI